MVSSSHQLTVQLSPVQAQNNPGSMTLTFVLLAVFGLVAAEKTPPPTASYQHTPPPYQTAAPAYGYQPQYHHQPQYQPQAPSYQQPAPHSYCPQYPEEPACTQNTTDPWCLLDAEYPEYEIKHAITYHKHKVLELYADVADLSTDNSVERLEAIEEETYLCSTEVGYVRPLRAVNTEGKWRVIVNNVKVDYETFTQTSRIEKCLTAGEACPLIPHCYETSCLQKSAYVRFLVYDSCDQYFPFAIESFKLPSACACHMSAYEITH